MDIFPQLPVAADWFRFTWVTGRTAVLTEPHMDELLAPSIWHLRGRERDLLVDTGNGVGTLRRSSRASRAAGAHGRSSACVTHAHIDHIGGFHEFEQRLLHPAEEELAPAHRRAAPLATTTWPEELMAQLAESGFQPPPSSSTRSRSRASTRRSGSSPPPRPTSSGRRRARPRRPAVHGRSTSRPHARQHRAHRPRGARTPLRRRDLRRRPYRHASGVRRRGLPRHDGGPAPSRRRRRLPRARLAVRPRPAARARRGVPARARRLSPPAGAGARRPASRVRREQRDRDAGEHATPAYCTRDNRSCSTT